MSYLLKQRGWRYQSGREVTTAIIIPRKKQSAEIPTAARASLLLPPAIPAAIIERMIAGAMRRSGCQARPISAAAIAIAERKPATVLEGVDSSSGDAWSITGSSPLPRARGTASEDTCAAGRRAGEAASRAADAA